MGCGTGVRILTLAPPFEGGRLRSTRGGGARSPEGHAPGISKGSNLRTNGCGGDRPPGDVSQADPETVTHTDRQRAHNSKLLQQAWLRGTTLEGGLRGSGLEFST